VVVAQAEAGFHHSVHASLPCAPAYSAHLADLWRTGPGSIRAVSQQAPCSSPALAEGSRKAGRSPADLRHPALRLRRSSRFPQFQQKLYGFIRFKHIQVHRNWPGRRTCGERLHHSAALWRKQRAYLSIVRCIIQQQQCLHSMKNRVINIGELSLALRLELGMIGGRLWSGL